jgi:hypothetical protein
MRMTLFKNGEKKSFPALIQQISPEPNTLEVFLHFLRDHPSVACDQDDLLEESIHDRPLEKDVPWALWPTSFF